MTTMETNPVDLTALAEHLHLAAATKEITRDGAVAFILHLCGPEMTTREAGRIYRSADPTQMACSWERHPTTGDLIPKFGPPRRLWDRLHGRNRGIPVIPEIARAYGDDINKFTDLP